MSRWRLSSPPQAISLGPNLPVFRALSPDWSPGWTAGQAAVVRGQKQDLLKTFSCSKGSGIYIGKAGKDKSCSRKKRLREDGTITEEICVKTSCSKHRLPCQPDAINKVHVQCHKHLHTPLFFGGLSSLTPVNFVFAEERISGMCCVNSSNYLQFIGQDCFDFSLFNITNDICHFSEIFRIQPCSNIGQQKHTKYCKFPNKECVVSSTSLSFCEKTNYITNICDIDDFNCDSVKSMKP